MPPDVQSFGTRFRVVKSRIGQIPFNSGNVSTLELPRSFLYKQLCLRLEGSTTGAAGSTLITDEQPLELIRNIQVIADGRKLFVSASARQLYRLAQFQHGIEPFRLGSEVGGAVTRVFRAFIIIDFEAARMQMPADSYLDPRPYEKMELRIQWGTFNDLISGAITFAVAPTLDVTLIHTTKGVEIAKFNRLHLSDDIPILATSNNLVQRVPRSGLLAHTLLTTLQGTGGRLLGDGVVNFVSVRSDNNFLHFDRIAWADLLGMSQMDHQMQSRITPTLAAFGATVGQNPPIGHAMLDYGEDGMLSSIINTQDLNTLDLVLDVTNVAATDHVQALHVFYEPISG